MLLKEKPKIAENAFITKSTQIIGAVELGAFSSIWYNVVIRADINTIHIGDYSNIQDGSILHVDHDAPLYIGNYVTIGHNVILHGCRVNDYALIGMGAVILNHADIGKNAQVAAGALVTPGFSVPENTLVMGIPAKIIRELSEEEKKNNQKIVKDYYKLCREYKTQSFSQWEEDCK
jgi:carbonic anhydrase/acetyltransferase-like protein (isoleucine patch superfamily)